MDIILLVVGLVFLFLGGEAILRGSVAIAHRFKLSTLLVSMVIVGFGTSLPELMVSVTAALGGVPNIALGNVVGSNIANILLILGLAAILAPVSCGGREVKRDALAVLLASLVLVMLSFHGVIGRSAGIGMVAALIAYLTYAYFVERQNQKRGEELLQRVERDISAPTIALSHSHHLQPGRTDLSCGWRLCTGRRCHSDCEKAGCVGCNHWPYACCYRHIFARARDGYCRGLSASRRCCDGQCYGQ